MHALYLPGYSPGNRAATYELAGEVTGFQTSTVFEYPHWGGADSEQPAFDLDRTCDGLIAAIAGIDGDSVIIAKSMGVNVCLRAQTISNAFEPTQVVFIGAAINEHARKSVPIDLWLKDYRTPSLWLQQRDDPTLSAEDLDNYLESAGLASRELVVMDGNAHEYGAAAVAEIIGQRLELS